VLGLVDDPTSALLAIASVLRPDGALSLVVSQRHAAVLARAMAGHFTQAMRLLEGDPQPPSGESRASERRFTTDEITPLLDTAGFTIRSSHGIRVFTDLVPSSLLDLEPGAAAALLELERAVSDRPEYLTLASQLHLVATR
jgi:S-adenosylmethionine-dependent methyltransferase